MKLVELLENDTRTVRSLFESASPRIFHGCNINNAIGIVNEGRFKLKKIENLTPGYYQPGDYNKEAIQQLVPHINLDTYPYYLCCTFDPVRSHYTNADLPSWHRGVVLLEMDSVKLNSNSNFEIDRVQNRSMIRHWIEDHGDEPMDPVIAAIDEKEERIFSKVPTVSSDNIRAIHVWADGNDSELEQLKYLVNHSQRPIPIHVYYSLADCLTARSMNESQTLMEDPLTSVALGLLIKSGAGPVAASAIKGLVTKIGAEMVAGILALRAGYVSFTTVHKIAKGLRNSVVDPILLKYNLLPEVRKMEVTYRKMITAWNLAKKAELDWSKNRNPEDLRKIVMYKKQYETLAAIWKNGVNFDMAGLSAEMRATLSELDTRKTENLETIEKVEKLIAELEKIKKMKEETDASI